jgi:hypothetical protein
MHRMEGRNGMWYAPERELSGCDVAIMFLCKALRKYEKEEQTVEYKVRQSIYKAQREKEDDDSLCFYEWFEHRGWFKPTAETMLWRARVIVEVCERLIEWRLTAFGNVPGKGSPYMKEFEYFKDKIEEYGGETASDSLSN